MSEEAMTYRVTRLAGAPPRRGGQVWDEGTTESALSAGAAAAIAADPGYRIEGPAGAAAVAVPADPADPADLSAALDAEANAPDRPKAPRPSARARPE